MKGENWFSKYWGPWEVILNGKVVATGETAGLAYKRALKKTKSTKFSLSLPYKGDVLITRLWAPNPK